MEWFIKDEGLIPVLNFVIPKTAAGVTLMPGIVGSDFHKIFFRERTARFIRIRLHQEENANIH